MFIEVLKKRFSVFLLPVLTILLLSGCAQRSVIVSKGAPEEREGYQGMCVLGEKKENSVLHSLCNGDLKKIMEHTDMTPFQKADMMELVCGGKGKPEDIQKFYFSLPDDVRADLIRSFKLYGYHLHGYG